MTCLRKHPPHYFPTGILKDILFLGLALFSLTFAAYAAPHAARRVPSLDTHTEASSIVFHTTVTSLANTKLASKGFTPIQPSSHKTDVKGQNKSRPSLEMKKHQEETGSFHKEHPCLGKPAWDWWQGLMKDPPLPWKGKQQQLF